MSFCTVVNCMDGRVQDTVNAYLKTKYNVKYVDVITEPGPNKILAIKENEQLISSIYNRINISVNRHGSQSIAIVGHYDCAGNPVEKSVQNEQTLEAVKVLKKEYPNLEIIGLWLDKDWKVVEI